MFFELLSIVNLYDVEDKFFGYYLLFLLIFFSEVISFCIEVMENDNKENKFVLDDFLRM